jgi:hypothetical protein
LAFLFTQPHNNLLNSIHNEVFTQYAPLGLNSGRKKTGRNTGISGPVGATGAWLIAPASSLSGQMYFYACRCGGIARLQGHEG